MVSLSKSPYMASNPGVSLGFRANVEKDKRHTVMVVEDSPSTLAMLKMILESSGYSVVATRDGLEALQRFDEMRPDLVLLDLDLPTISGFRLIQLFRNADSPRAVPVVVVTGYDYEEAEEVVRAGAADLVTKPFDPRDLLDRVAQALRRAGCENRSLASEGQIVS